MKKRNEITGMSMMKKIIWPSVQAKGNSNLDIAMVAECMHIYIINN